MSEPISLIEKLGIPNEGSIAVLDDDGDLFKKLTLSTPSNVTLQRRIVGSKVDMIIIRIKAGVDHKQLFERLKNAIKPGGKIWIVIPKSVENENNTVFVSADDANLEVGDSVSLNDEEDAVQLLLKKETG